MKSLESLIEFRNPPGFLKWILLMSHFLLVTAVGPGKLFPLYILHLCQEGGVIITGHYYGSLLPSASPGAHRVSCESPTTDQFCCCLQFRVRLRTLTKQFACPFIFVSQNKKQHPPPLRLSFSR